MYTHYMYMIPLLTSLGSKRSPRHYIQSCTPHISTWGLVDGCFYLKGLESSTKDGYMCDQKHKGAPAQQVFTYHAQHLTHSTLTGALACHGHVSSISCITIAPTYIHIYSM